MSNPLPSSELFDVVDEQDQVIRQEPRDKVHAEKLLHRAVHLLMFNRRDQVFLQRRSLSKDTFPGRLSTSAAGHVDAGEDYDTALMREVSEELGIRPDTLPEKLFKLDACAETGEEFVWVYRLKWDASLKLNRDEIDGGEWYPAKKLAARMEREPDAFAPSACYVWKHYCAKQIHKA